MQYLVSIPCARRVESGIPGWTYTKRVLGTHFDRNEARIPMSTIAVGYMRVSTPRQGETGYGLDSQKHAIEDEAVRRGWELTEQEFSVKREELALKQVAKQNEIENPTYPK